MACIRRREADVKHRKAEGENFLWQAFSLKTSMQKRNRTTRPVSRHCRSNSYRLSRKMRDLFVPTAVYGLTLVTSLHTMEDGGLVNDSAC